MVTKRVWGIEQGVMDGTITQRWGWGPHQAPLDHEMVKKRFYIYFGEWQIVMMNTLRLE